MKKYLLLALAILMGSLSLQAGPVDVETAKTVGQQFAATSFNSLRQQPELKLVYTGTSDRGEACFYAFDVNKRAFVIVSADDRFRPIVGYSDEGPFETENPSPEMMFYLEKIIEARTSPQAVLPEDAAQEWQALLSKGAPLSRNGGRGAQYLCQTKWNQNSPYNLYAPAATSGPDGRCYAGCVATAMSQVMKYWDHPASGTGSHGYYSNYGYLSVNFGNTQYRWDLMPNRIGGNTTQEQIEAIALLMYHCGVSVNMSFGPNGSGAFSDDVPEAIRHYFSYTNQTDHGYRDEYSLNQWKNKLKEQFDLGWPVYYSGYSESGGHAFVCDGYDDNDLFHYNWGWGGSSDGWFVIDEIDYANWASAIFNFVPTDIYLYMPASPTNFTVESLADTDFSAVLSWTNPTQTIHGDAISSLDQVVVARNGKAIQVFENVAPGQTMTYTDHFLPTVVDYEVYAIVNSAKSGKAVQRGVALGPSCTWTIEMDAPAGQAWGGGSISVLDGSGIEIAKLSPESGKKTVQFEMPLGRISFYWNAHTEPVDAIHFAIYDINGDRVMGFDGHNKYLKEGLLYQSYNSCTTSEAANPPSDLRISLRNQDVMLQWNVSGDQPLAFFVYRDGVLYDMVRENSYLDLDASDSFHSYYVTAFDGEAETAPSSTCNIQPTSPLLAPTNFRYEIVNQNRVKLYWDPVETDEEVCYMLYSRSNGKPFNNFKTVTVPQYAITLSTWAWDLYDLAVTAYYESTGFESGFGTTQEDPSKYYLELNKSLIPTHLDYDAMEDGVTLVWTPAIMTNRYAVYRNGVLLSDQVTEATYFDAEAPHGQPCCYQVVGMNDQLVSNPSFKVCVDWASTDLNESVEEMVKVSPNPVSSQLTIAAEGLLNVAVYNHLGQLVLQRTTQESTLTLDVDSWSAGLYLVHLTSATGTKVVKVVKE